MKEYWDARAEEDPFYFVDNQLDYRHPDMERFWDGGRTALDRICEALGVEIQPTDSIVEIGCGAGRITRVLAERGRDVRALDVSERMLEVARELNANLDNVSWILGDGVSLAGIDDASADVCHSHVVFQHIPDPAVTLGYVREMGRVLRPGGWAAFQVSTDPSVHRPRGPAQRLRWRMAAGVRRGPRAQEHAAWLGAAVEPGALEQAAAGAGLRLEQVLGSGTQFTTVLARRG
jgi:SAM-dependent methyltransferase